MSLPRPKSAKGESSGEARQPPIRLLSDALAARLALALFSVVSIFMVAHRVSVAIYGIYATAVAFTMLLGTFTDLGSSAVVIREGTEVGDRAKVATTYLQVRVALICVTCIGGALVALVAFPRDAVGPALLSLLSVIFSGPTLISPLGQLYGSMRTFRQSAIVQGASTLLATLTTLWVWSHPSPLALVGANVFGGVIGTIWAARATRRWAGPVLGSVDWPRARSMVKSISALGLAAIVTTAYGKIDGILLLDIKGSHAAGLYAAAVRLLDQSSMVPIAIMTPVSPLIAAQIRATAQVSWGVDRGLRRIELWSGAALGLLIIGSAYWVTQALLGSRFGPSARLVCLLAVSQSWVVVAYVSTAKIVHGKRERPYVYVTLAGLLVNVAVNLVLIPRYGASGAAYATIATELMTVCAYSTVSRRFSTTSRWRGLAGLILAISAACAIALWSLSEGTPARIAVSVGLCLVGCGTAIFALRGLDAALSGREGIRLSPVPAPAAR